MRQPDPYVSVYFDRIPGRDAYGLFIIDRRYGTSRQAFADSVDEHGEIVWTEEDRGEFAKLNPLLIIPGPIAGAFAESISAVWTDTQPDPGTEAKVLKEALMHERSRVDTVLSKLVP